MLNVVYRMYYYDTDLDDVIASEKVYATILKMKTHFYVMCKQNPKMMKKYQEWYYEDAAPEKTFREWIDECFEDESAWDVLYYERIEVI